MGTFGKIIPSDPTKMQPHNLDVQAVADMLVADNCPASMGCFDYPNGKPGLLLIMALPDQEQAVRDFLQTLYDKAGYVSPVYPGR